MVDKVVPLTIAIWMLSNLVLCFNLNENYKIVPYFSPTNPMTDIHFNSNANEVK